MKTFRQFVAAPVMALCALLTFSACSNDPDGPTGSTNGDLVEFEVLNASPFSLDLKVDMKKGCAKYVATVYRENVYVESDFIETAIMSIDPTEDQLEVGMQPFLVNTKSAMLSEKQLAKNTPYSSSECEGVTLNRFQSGAGTGAGENRDLQKYIVAIYAVNSKGEATVYLSKQAFTLPEAASSSTTTVNITATATYTKVTATFTGSADCAKIIRGSMTADSNPTNSGLSGEEFWAESNSEAIIDFLNSCQTIEAPDNYNGTPTTHTLKQAGMPGQSIVVFARAITADGKVGPSSYKIVPLRMPDLNGTASVTKLEFQEATTESLAWKVETSAGAKAVRLLVTSKFAFDNTFVDRNTQELIQPMFNWHICTDESPNSYGFTQTMTAEELAATGGIFKHNIQPTPYGDTYVVYASAQDANGNWTEPMHGEDQKAIGLEAGSTIDFSKGKGQMTLTPTWSEVDGFDPTNPQYNVTFTVTKGENTKNIYLLPDFGNYDYSKYEDYTDYVKLLATCEFFFTLTALDEEKYSIVEPGKEYTESWMWAPSSYGSDSLIFITEDNDGYFKIGAVAVPNKEVIYPTPVVN